MDAGGSAEQGGTGPMFPNAKQPDTQGLLASLPTRGKRGQRLYSIPGSVPDPAHKPDGCPFQPRCPHAVESCRREYPAMCDYGEGHMARCPVLFGEWKE
jgi:peptide/nickel transport system ATP-binding protein/oligopeptide transport system ATP-binding protein